jgi:glycosyltransferase involved in cell wall biosynthesis
VKLNQIRIFYRVLIFCNYYQCPSIIIKAIFLMKSNILITPNNATWIIGEMSKSIMAQYGDRYNFYFMTDKLLKFRPDLGLYFAKNIDFLMAMSLGGFDPIWLATRPHTPASLFWVHHVTEWTPGTYNAVDLAQEVIVTTESWAQEVRKVFPEKNITVVRHGVDSQLFYRRAACRARFNIPKQAFCLGFVGSKTSDFEMGRKGLEVLHHALNRLKVDIPTLHICFLGIGWQEEVNQLKAAGISANYISFIAKSELPLFYSNIDAYVMTSEVEGGPCTVLEAMACETPVIATRVGLVPLVVKDGVNSYSVEVGDVEGICAAALSLAQDPQNALEVGKKAREAVVKLTWQFTFQALEPVLIRMAQPSLASTKKLPFNPEQFMRAVSAADALLWTAATLKKRLIPWSSTWKMLRNSWENLTYMDILRGIGLLLRICYRVPSPKKNHLL